MTTIPNTAPPVKPLDVVRVIQQLAMCAAINDTHSGPTELAADSVLRLTIDTRLWDLGRTYECVRDIGGTILSLSVEVETCELTFNLPVP